MNEGRPGGRSVKYDPAFFELKIPHGYKGADLPLWQFAIQPNPEFRDE